MADEKANPDQQAASDEVTKASSWRWMVWLVAFIAALAGGAYLTFVNYDKVAAIASYAGASESGGRTFGTFGEIKNVVVNPAGTSGGRYLMVSLGLEAPSKNVIEEVESKEVVIRDLAIGYLSKKTPDELAKPEDRDAIKKKLLEKVNQLLTGQKVDRLYFTQYVIQ